MYGLPRQPLTSRLFFVFCLPALLAPEQAAAFVYSALLDGFRPSHDGIREAGPFVQAAIAVPALSAYLLRGPSHRHQVEAVQRVKWWVLVSGVWVQCGRCALRWLGSKAWPWRSAAQRRRTVLLASAPSSALRPPGSVDVRPSTRFESTTCGILTPEESKSL